MYIYIRNHTLNYSTAKITLDYVILTTEMYDCMVNKAKVNFSLVQFSMGWTREFCNITELDSQFMEQWFPNKLDTILDCYINLRLNK